MARRKKKETALSLEERLEAALVPSWEQPYKVPENWRWTTIGKITEVASGGTPASGISEYYEDGTIPWISPADLSEYDDVYISHGRKMITVLGLERSSARLLPAKTVCLSSRAPIGYVAIAQNQLATNQGFKNFLPSPAYVPEYLYWYLKGNKAFLEAKASGTTFLELSGSKAAQIEFPIAPLAEQQRIVDRIESLFAKLDEAKEKAQEALDSIEIRKVAMLHKAYNGDLTVSWRKRNNRSLDEWTTKKFSEISKVVRGGSPRPAGDPRYYGGNIPFMKVADITRNNGPYVHSTENTITEAGLHKTRMVQPNTLLLTNSGATLGVPAICTFNTTFNDGIAAFLGLPEDSLLYFYYFWTSKTQELRTINQGAAQPNLNTDIIGSTEISIAPKEEQTEIVRLLDTFFAKEDEAKAQVEATLEAIDLMKKSILAKAFRGELGTNDPAEESAESLIRQVLKVDAPTPKRVKAIQISKELSKELSSELEKKLVKLFLKGNADTLRIDTLMGVAKDKFAIMESLCNLEQKQIIKHLASGDYRFMR